MPIAWVVPAVVATLALVAGVRLREKPWLNAPAIAATAVCSAAAGVLVATTYDPEVGKTDLVVGTVLAVVAVGALPFALYYLLGRALAHRPLLLGAVALATLVPLYYYLFIALVISIGYVHCPPDANDCPL